MATGTLTLGSGFEFRSWQMPRAQEKCIAHAKAVRVRRVAQLIDLYWDGETKDRSLDQAASMPVPARW